MATHDTTALLAPVDDILLAAALRQSEADTPTEAVENALALLVVLENPQECLDAHDGATTIRDTASATSAD